MRLSASNRQDKAQGVRLAPGHASEDVCWSEQVRKDLTAARCAQDQYGVSLVPQDETRATETAHKQPAHQRDTRLSAKHLLVMMTN